MNLTTSPPITTPPQWRKATWSEYLAYFENSNLAGEDLRIFFDNGNFWVDMGNEGLNHSKYNDLLSFIFLTWFASKFPQTQAESFSGCVIEKPKVRGASPDKVLYIGENIPEWQEGEPRRINLNQWRVPDLVGEISDTTLAIDLDEKKKLYAALEIPEYWVIDIQGNRILAFRLDSEGKYQPIQTSVALAGLPLSLVEMTLRQLKNLKNVNAALWFAKQLGASDFNSNY